MLVCILLFAVNAMFSQEKPFRIELGAGVGNILNSPERHSQGKGYLHLSPKYLLSSEISIGIDFIGGGDLIPTGGLYLEEEEDYRILNPAAVGFNACALNLEYKPWSKALSYLYFGASSGISDLNYRSIEVIGEELPGADNNLFLAFEVGYAYKEVRVSFNYQHYGAMDDFEGITADHRLALTGQNVSMLFLSISYNWDLKL